MFAGTTWRRSRRPRRSSLSWRLTQSRTRTAGWCDTSVPLCLAAPLSSHQQVVNTRTQMHTRTYTHTHKHTHSDTHKPTRAYNTCKHSCKPAYTYKHSSTNYLSLSISLSHTYTHTHARTHASTHARTHTRKHTLYGCKNWDSVYKIYGGVKSGIIGCANKLTSFWTEIS